MTPDRPTGPATAAGRSLIDAEMVDRLFLAQGSAAQMNEDEMVQCVKDIEAEAAARILAALPGALQRSRIYCDGEDLPDGVQCARCANDAAALAAAVEKVLGEEK